MDEFEPNWKPPTSHPILDVAAAVSSEAVRLVSEQAPELADLFPVRNRCKTRLGFGNGWVGIIVDYLHSPGIPSAGDLEATEAQDLEQAAQTTLMGSHGQLQGCLPAGYFTFTRFTYVGPYVAGMLSWPHITSHLVAWLNGMLVPEVLRRNQARVLLAVPQPPQIDVGRLMHSLWVLECDETHRQGTAFMLDGVGLVTCEHVIGRDTQAFRPSEPARKWPIQVLASNATLDLAVIAPPASHTPSLKRDTGDILKVMDHLVVCGFPNYRLGDSGTVVPGLVVGFRPVSGVRRILTNALIIAGCSGGPVLNAAGRVIGVAVTGADRMEAASETEHHSVIPIDALVLIPGQ